MAQYPVLYSVLYGTAVSVHVFVFVTVATCVLYSVTSAMGFQIEFIFSGDLQRLSQGGCHAQYLGNSVILNFPMCCSLKIDFHLKSIRASLDLLSF